MYVHNCLFSVYQNAVPNYETPFGSDSHKDNSTRNEVTPYLVPQVATAKNHSKVASRDYESLPNSDEYASAVCVYYNLMRTSATNNSSSLEYSEIFATSTNDEEEVYSDPGHSEAEVFACFEKKRFCKIKINEVRYVMC